LKLIITFIGLSFLIGYSILFSSCNKNEGNELSPIVRADNRPGKEFEILAADSFSISPFFFSPSTKFYMINKEKGFLGKMEISKDSISTNGTRGKITKIWALNDTTFSGLFNYQPYYPYSERDTFCLTADTFYS